MLKDFIRLDCRFYHKIGNLYAVAILVVDDLREVDRLQ